METARLEIYDHARLCFPDAYKVITGRIRREGEVWSGHVSVYTANGIQNFKAWSGGGAVSMVQVSSQNPDPLPLFDEANAGGSDNG